MQRQPQPLRYLPIVFKPFTNGCLALLPIANSLRKHNLRGWGKCNDAYDKRAEVCASDGDSVADVSGFYRGFNSAVA